LRSGQERDKCPDSRRQGTAAEEDNSKGPHEFRIGELNASDLPLRYRILHDEFRQNRYPHTSFDRPYGTFATR
jgi:hypothetical protein